MTWFAISTGLLGHTHTLTQTASESIRWFKGLSLISIHHWSWVAPAKSCWVSAALTVNISPLSLSLVLSVSLWLTLSFRLSVWLQQGEIQLLCSMLDDCHYPNFLSVHVCVFVYLCVVYWTPDYQLIFLPVSATLGVRVVCRWWQWCTKLFGSVKCHFTVFCMWNTQ